MFDFFQIVDFKGTNNFKEKKYSFLNNSFYEKIDSVEFIRRYNNSYVCYLEREKINNNFFVKDGKNVFIFGTVFTNNFNQEKSCKNPYIVYASDVYDLFEKYGDELVDYIKGSFVIVIYDEVMNSVKIISDRLNVHPLYYSYSGSTLIVSSSLRMILESGFVSNKFDNTSLIQQLIFDYVLGARTFYRNICRVDNGMIYTFSEKEKTDKRYWSVTELHHEKLLPKSDSLEMLSIQLHQNTNLYCSDTDKVLVALTGGLDGRANLALLDKNPEDFLCYSYGMPGSQQVEIPKEIAKRLKINYRPVLLDEKYEEEHDICTMEAIEYSNGTAPIIRSNYPYAYKNLNSFSKTIMTGLFGSEIMRPLHNLGIMMNDYSEALFLSNSPKDKLKDILSGVGKRNYLNRKIIDDSSEEIIEEIYKEYFDKYKNYDKILRFFFFIIQEGVRKYFSQEIQIERVYVTTRFPFFDDDFVQLMYKTPYAGMYNGFLGKSKMKRRKGQLLYAYIYKKFKPELGKIRLDRGYKPDDLLKLFPFNFFPIYSGVRKTAAYKKEKGNDTFNSEKWTQNFIFDSINHIKDRTGIFGSGLKNNFENKSYLKDLLKYSHFISMLKYFNSF
jgi:asparagine synthetase B (glutamine-hydrolysing)